ncbi:MAG: hypothetical protein H0U45_06370 [Tatlockia sp.]|nr:hypothetical protein [Tatlockia sp.]
MSVLALGSIDGDGRQPVLLPIAAYRLKPFVPGGNVFYWARTCSIFVMIC